MASSQIINALSFFGDLVQQHTSELMQAFAQAASKWIEVSVRPNKDSRSTILSRAYEGYEHLIVKVVIVGGGQILLVGGRLLK